MKDKLSWPVAAVVMAALLAVTALALLGKDTTAITTLAIGVLGALGLAAGGAAVGKIDAKVDVGNQQTNGNTTRLLAIIEAFGHRLGDMAPPGMLESQLVPTSGGGQVPLDTGPTAEPTVAYPVWPPESKPASS